MPLLIKLGREGLMRFNALLKNAQIIDKPEKKISHDKKTAGKHIDRDNSLDRNENPDDKTGFTT